MVQWDNGSVGFWINNSENVDVTKIWKRFCNGYVVNNGQYLPGIYYGQSNWSSTWFHLLLRLL